MTAIFVCFLGLTSCDNQKLEIKPIDKELNDKAEYGIQYFEISNYNNFSNEELMNELENFEKNSNKKRDLKSYTMFQVLFYKKSIFANYEKYVYETARDNEFGGIKGFEDNLIAKIYYYKGNLKKDKYDYKRILYNNNSIVFEKKDTIPTK